MRNGACLIALAAGLVAAGFWLQPAASGQAKPDLAEKFTPGLRRTATIARTYTQVIETLAGAEVEARQTQTIKTTALVHDWYAELNAQGWPARIVRTYRDLKRTQTTEDWAKGAEAVTATSDTTPTWAGLVLTLETLDGELRVTDGAGGLNDFARASVVGDFETDLQPHRAKEVGKGWKIRGSGLEPLRDNLDPAVYEDGFVTITLKALDSVNATFEFRGSLKFRQKRADPDNPGQDVTNLLHESDLKGSAEFDVAAGRWLSRELTVESKLSGKRDGRTVQGTATLTDKRAFTWGKIIATAPDNGLIEGQGLTEHKVYAKGKIAPDKLVVGVASDKRSAIVEFDPATQKITRTLIAFPPKVQYGNIALSPDRAKLAFASTLNNDLTLEPWNIFVLDLEAGKLNQITPEWVSGDGIVEGKELKDGQRVEIHLDWKGPFDGVVWIAGVSQPLYIKRPEKDFDGKIVLENVPAGEATIAVIGYTGEGWRTYWYNAPFDRNLSVSSTLPVMSAAVTAKIQKDKKNVVPLRLSSSGVQQNTNPTWHKDQVAYLGASPNWSSDPASRSMRSGGLTRGKAGAEHSLKHGHRFAPIHATCNPQGSAFVEVLPQERDSRKFDFRMSGIVDGKQIHVLKFDATGAIPDHTVQGCWSGDGSAWLTGGTAVAGGGRTNTTPALISARAEDGTTRVVSQWAELSGRRILDIAASSSGVIYFAIATNPDAVDLYEFDPATDSIRRLTALGDVTTIANVGR